MIGSSHAAGGHLARSSRLYTASHAGRQVDDRLITRNYNSLAVNGGSAVPAPGSVKFLPPTAFLHQFKLMDQLS